MLLLSEPLSLSFSFSQVFQVPAEDLRHILHTDNFPPFLSDKYDLTRHPNYRYTADADPKNVFDMERYMKKQRAVDRKSVV